MNVKHLRDILESLNGVGITEVVMNPTDKGALVSGSNRERSVVCFHEVDGFDVGGKSLAIQNVNALLSRVSLFNDAEVDNVDDGGYYRTLNFKEGRRKASYHCADRKHIMVPRQAPGETNITAENGIVLQPEHVEFIGQAVSSMSLTGNREAASISMNVKAGDLYISIFDGQDDKVTEVIHGVGKYDTDLGTWGIEALHRVLRRASQSSEVVGSRIGIEMPKGSVVFCITEYRVAVIGVAGIDVLVIPVV